MIKVSIIMPCFNVEKYIIDALNSIAQQTYKNFEVIIVNDGSTDNTLQLIEHYNYSFKKTIVNQENKGLSEARNTGMHYISGEYVYFFDSDDLMSPDLLQDCVDFCDSKQLDVCHFNCNVLLESENKLITESELQKDHYYKNKILINRKIYGRSQFINNFIYSPRVSVWLYFYRVNFLKENNLFFYPNILHEDELFTIEAILKIKKIGFLEKSYFIRRIRDGSIMTSTKNKEQKEKSKKIIISQFKKISEKNNLDCNQKKLLYIKTFDLARSFESEWRAIQTLNRIFSVTSVVTVLLLSFTRRLYMKFS